MTDAQPSPYSAAAVEETELQRVTRERDELRDAARAVVEATRMQPCDFCGRLALVVDRDGDPLCEAHTHLSRVDKQELPYAPAWRRLCALVEGK